MSLWMWITLAMMAAIAGLAASVWRKRQVPGGSSDAVYKDQLAEIDREEKSGLLEPADARMARLEIQRRLIASGAVTEELEVRDMTKTDRMTLVMMAAVVAVGSAIVYSVTGSPDVDGHPAVSRANSTVMSADLSDLSSPKPAQAASTANTNLPSVDTMIVRLEDRLQANPDDVEGWKMLGWSKFKTGDTEGAATAYAKAVALDPEDGRIQSIYGESLILSSGGFVSDTAEAALQKAVALDPDDARARFLLGLKKQQDGDIQGSIDDWITLLETAPADADWYDDVRGRTVELAASSGMDISDRLPPARGAVTASAPTVTAASGPTSEQVAAADTMAPEDRQAMIDGMVSRLDARLEQNPDDLQGWIRLIDSRQVLKQDGLAEEAHARAAAYFSEDSSAMAALDEALNTRAQ
ncbi:MAG: c-type cytochrome biogenesis protein CcmI [Henriciella sp.]